MAIQQQSWFRGLTLLTVLGVSGTVCGEVVIELPGLVGQYAAGEMRTLDFDAETVFGNIDSVYIRWAGGITPGEGHGDGIERPIDEWFEWLARFEGTMDPPGPGRWRASSPETSTFRAETPLSPSGNPTWDFLLDGEGSVSVSLDPEIVIGGVMVTPPSGQITEASLVIEGSLAVPALPTWGLVLLALLMLTAGTVVFVTTRCDRRHTSG